MRKGPPVAALVLAAVVAMAAFPLSGRATPPARLFSETGFTVEGRFLDYWDRNGGLAQQGYPISAEIEQADPRGGRLTVQYFERARFEYHPENAGTPYEVLLGQLGREAYTARYGERRPPAQEAGPGARYFLETEQWVPEIFARYWDGHGGLAQQGYPISPPFRETSLTDGREYLVQYFERARFEHHPENAGTPYEVLLGQLGRESPLRPGAPNQPPPGPLKAPHLSYGFVLELNSAEVDRQRSLDLVQGAHFGWVRQQVTWFELEPSPGQFDWSRLDPIVQATSQRGIKILLSVTKAPSWAANPAPAGCISQYGIPRDPATFARVMQALAARYQGKVQAYELWNEQNTGGETACNIDPGAYVELLMQGYTAVKSADPAAVVVYGGLTPTGVMDRTRGIDDVGYLEQTYLYRGGIMRGYFDVLGAHPGSNNNDPDSLWPDIPGPGTGPAACQPTCWQTHPSFYFRRIEQLRQVMEKYGDADKQMWLTEFGWSTPNQAPGYEYGATISFDTQARYIARAYEKGKNDYPWMGVMFLWNLNYSVFTGPADEKGPWSVINQDWSPRPAYLAVRDLVK